MKIINTPPPNYEEIKKHFPNADFNKDTVFTYGKNCYCRSSLTPDLIVHEETHTKQQINPKEWWNKYCVDVVFRLSQEAEAYHNQWKWIDRNIKDRNRKFQMLYRIAKDLSGGLYNNLISFDKAIQLIKNGNK